MVQSKVGGLVGICGTNEECRLRDFICGIKEVGGLMVECGLERVGGLEGARDLESKCEIYEVNGLEGVGTLG